MHNLFIICLVIKKQAKKIENFNSKNIVKKLEII